jgi:hypothetical protein
VSLHNNTKICERFTKTTELTIDVTFNGKSITWLPEVTNIPGKFNMNSMFSGVKGKNNI